MNMWDVSSPDKLRSDSFRLEQGQGFGLMIENKLVSNELPLSCVLVFGYEDFCIFNCRMEFEYLCKTFNVVGLKADFIL